MPSRVRTLLAGAGLAGYIRSGNVVPMILRSYDNYRRRMPLHTLTPEELELPKWKLAKTVAEHMPTPTTLWIWRVPRGARGNDNPYRATCMNYGCWPHPKPKKAKKPVAIQGRGGLQRPHPPEEEEDMMHAAHPSYKRFELRMVAGLKKRVPNVAEVAREAPLPWPLNNGDGGNLFQQARAAFDQVVDRVVMPVQAPQQVDMGNIFRRFEP